MQKTDNSKLTPLLALTYQPSMTNISRRNLMYLWHDHDLKPRWIFSILPSFPRVGQSSDPSEH